LKKFVEITQNATETKIEFDKFFSLERMFQTDLSQNIIDYSDKNSVKIDTLLHNNKHLDEVMRLTRNRDELDFLYDCELGMYLQDPLILDQMLFMAELFKDKKYVEYVELVKEKLLLGNCLEKCITSLKDYLNTNLDRIYSS